MMIGRSVCVKFLSAVRGAGFKCPNIQRLSSVGSPDSGLLVTSDPPSSATHNSQ